MDYQNLTTKHNTSVKTRTVILALGWGAVWAAFLQFSRPGRWLAQQRTYLTVVIGVGVDLLIALTEIPPAWVLRLFYIISASSVFIIVRSLANELHDQGERQNAVRARRPHR